MSKNYLSPNQEAVLKLIKLTSDSDIKWAETDKDLIALKEPINQGLIGKAFIAEYKGMLFRIFRFKRFGNPDYKSWWEPLTKLEVIDDKQEAIWEFPYILSLEDLYETVSFKTAGVDNIYNLILAEN